MSKRALKKYVASLSKEELEEQLIDLYERLDEVKTFYNFVFNPQEEKLLNTAKVKISREYFPDTRKRAKARRSIAQKWIKHFEKLGVDPFITADLMLYNLEIAQTFEEDQSKNPEAFYKAMFKFFSQACQYIIENGIIAEYRNRILKYTYRVDNEDWPNANDFLKISIQFED
ncbi:DUF6155 family protein [Zunongwangia sp.]|uniref:DUF6155 family protein n=1 Tax=Zunongwangia sp. TaxID=1965325 RepID=UPI003AA86441